MVFDLMLLILLIYVLIIYPKKYYNYFKQHKHKNICKKIYNEYNYNNKHLILNKLFNFNMCNSIIKEANKISQINGWGTKRHDDYPTTDLEINNKWDNYKLIDNKINILKTHFSSLFKINKDLIVLKEIFVVKYEYNQQTKLEKHTDGNEFSFITALNDSYIGGGTYFTKTNTHVDLNIGDTLIFSGQNEHQGIEINSGIRYILVGFLNYHSIDYCENNLCELKNN